MKEKIREVIRTKGKDIKMYVIIGLALALCVISFFVGRQNAEVVEVYKYIPSEREDSLVEASVKNNYYIDSIEGELRMIRLDLDTANFTSNEEVEKTIKKLHNELHDQSPSDIDTLFVHEYDSAVTSRRKLYNGQR